MVFHNDLLHALGTSLIDFVPSCYGAGTVFGSAGSSRLAVFSQRFPPSAMFSKRRAKTRSSLFVPEIGPRRPSRGVAW